MPGEPVLALANSEHLGPACGAYALSGWLAVLHGYGFGILHFFLSAALHTVCLHLFASFPKL